MKEKISNEEMIVAQYVCAVDRDCCSNNNKCTKKIAYDSSGKLILNTCGICSET